MPRRGSVSRQSTGPCARSRISSHSESSGGRGPTRCSATPLRRVMPYYRGDYYRGDYYRGDPFLGGLGRAIGRGFKVLGGAALGFITGGPGGAIAGALGGTAKAVTSGIREETMAAGGEGSAYTPELRAAHARAASHGAATARYAARTGLAPGRATQTGSNGLRKGRRLN